MCSIMLPLIMVSPVMAEEKIIQKETISFDKCLKVISTSEDKLLTSPEIKDLSDKKRVAIFTLIDGKLTITCDGENEQVIVSTKMD